MTVTLLRVTLAIPGPWAVGGVTDWRADADLPVLARVDDAGRSAYLPATSLVGGLRAHLRDQRGLAFTEAWLGPEPAEDDAPRVRSPLRVLGVQLADPGTLTTAATTAIDPRRRAATPNTLRTAERVESSGPTVATMYARVDDEVPRELLDLLRSWAPYVGRGRSVGLGKAEVTSAEALTLHLDDLDDLLWWLTRRDEWLTGHDAGMADRLTRGDLHDDVPSLPAVEYRFRLTERLAVGADGLDDPEPVAGRRKPKPRSVRTSASKPIVPGTSWKGLFRHRCNVILAAVGCDERTATSLVTSLFGSAPAEEAGFRGLLRFEDSPLTLPGGEPAVVERKHVAIDRFTGGALNGGHFAVNAVDRGTEMTCRIEAAAPLPDDTLATVLALLDAVARDLHDGIIGVGGLTTRGYGTVESADPSHPPALRVDATAIPSAAMTLHDVLHVPAPDPTAPLRPTHQGSDA